MKKLEQGEKELYEKFQKIARQRWVKGVNNNTNGAGLTLEKLLGKDADSMYFPDYYGIEIKTSQRYSGYPITLFTLAPDGPGFYEMNRLLQKFGVPDFQYSDKKTLRGDLKTNEYTLINKKYYFKLEVDRKNEKIYICVYDNNLKLIEKESYIEFKTIKNRIELKLSKMALVYASKKNIDGELYFRYYKITFYKLKSFDNFIELLEKDLIKVRIEGIVSRNGSEAGRQRNKNLVFYLPKENIDMLFDTTFTHNFDADNGFVIM